MISLRARLASRHPVVRVPGRGAGWQFGNGSDKPGPHSIVGTNDAERFGRFTLITDANNNRIVEVNAADTVVWEYRTDTESGTNSAPLPTRAVRLANGNTLISDQFNNRVIEITPAKDIVFQQGVLNTPGDGFNRLNGPYDAKVVGDFTGLTPPFDDD